MHSCIAALSQNIPAIGLAYSKKFYGVFDSIGLAECVADARYLDQDEILRKVHAIFEHRDQVRTQLSDITPHIRQDILSIFKDVDPQNRHDTVVTAI
jgi:polysaccharide pyruvyl transferase WcaK-like protein